MAWGYWLLIGVGLLILSMPISMWYIKVAPRKPTNEGDWVSDNAKTASASINNRIIKIKNVRYGTLRPKDAHSPFDV